MQDELGISVGLVTIEVEDRVQDARIPVRLLYPTRAPERSERFGPYEMRVAVDAPPVGEALPLVVVSHGTGGSPLTYRDLAAHLARDGFVVAMVEHPGNSRSDDSLAFTAANLENRPRHLRLVVDAAFASRSIGARLSRGGIGIVGHSMGAYTALAVAGGRPTALPSETSDGVARPVSVVPDARVRALVLLAPATIWYLGEGSLADVDVPILMRTAERDDYVPSAASDIVLRGVRDPSRVDHRVVAGAGHFAFQSPFPESMTRPDFPPSQDPPGFDRAAYQPVLREEIAAFLRATLRDGTNGAAGVS